MVATIQVGDLIWFLIVGCLAGWAASFLLRGKGLGLVGDMVIGVLGAFLGSFLARVCGLVFYGVGGLLITSILGAMVLLVILRMVYHRGARA